ncbi:transposase [Crystallibacter degradans]|uniref:transposase n=1 Tax=Crystallibacter degradans TaxID=2726743 RepID=UPI001475332C|nr:transposase [Arthrobacter sp. SF27]NMR32283.1 transposase [Arthrobacter sp. SF27]
MPSYKKLFEEPDDHAIGMSRGGLTTKIHNLRDGKMHPLVILVGPGQGGDAPMFAPVLDALRVGRFGPGRARTRPDRALADKAYSSKAIRDLLDKEAYKRRNVVELSFNVFKQWRGLATRYDKLALTYRGGVVLRAITIWLKDRHDSSNLGAVQHSVLVALVYTLDRDETSTSWVRYFIERHNPERRARRLVNDPQRLAQFRLSSYHL